MLPTNTLPDRYYLKRIHACFSTVGWFWYLLHYLRPVEHKQITRLNTVFKNKDGGKYQSPIQKWIVDEGF
jgi:hypothetical protein